MDDVCLVPDTAPTYDDDNISASASASASASDSNYIENSKTYGIHLKLRVLKTTQLSNKYFRL